MESQNDTLGGVAPSSPLDTEELLDGLEATSSLLEAAQLETLEPTSRTARPLDAQASSPPAKADGQQLGDDEESVEQYVQNLLNRYGVNSAVIRAETVSHAPVPSEAPAAPQVATASSTGAMAENRSAKGTQPARPPECRDDLSSMRELANFNARNAIESHSCKQLISTLYGKLGFSIAVIVIAWILAAISRQAWSLSFAGAVVALLVAIASTAKYLRMTHGLSKQAWAAPARRVDGELPAPEARPG